jgi:hypothetical protein
LAPAIKAVFEQTKEHLAIEKLQQFTEQREQEIEKICQNNYQVRHYSHINIIEPSLSCFSGVYQITGRTVRSQRRSSSIETIDDTNQQRHSNYWQRSHS